MDSWGYIIAFYDSRDLNYRRPWTIFQQFPEVAGGRRGPGKYHTPSCDSVACDCGANYAAITERLH